MYKVLVSSFCLLALFATTAQAQPARKGRQAKASAGVPVAPVMQKSEPVQPAYEDAQPLERARHFTVGLFVGGEGDLNFTNVKIEGDSNTHKANMELAGAVGLILEYRLMNKNNWGLQAGLEIEKARDWKSSKFDDNGRQTYTSDIPTFRSEILYVNAVYRWDSFYIPFGLNYSIPHMTNQGNFKVSGSVGGQVGVGWQINELFGLELQSHVTGVTMKVEEEGQRTVDLGYGVLPEARLLGKFSF